MKKHPTREKILEASKNILKTQDVKKFHMRNIAKEAGIALGTTYNYFENKDEIILALAEEFWVTSLLVLQKEMETERPILPQLDHMYQTLYKEFSTFESDLLKLLSEINTTDKEVGLGRERIIFKEFGKQIYQILERDEISSEVWSPTFTKIQMSEFIIGQFMKSLGRREKNIDYLLEILNRLLLKGRY